MERDLLKEHPVTPDKAFKKNIMTVNKKVITYSHIYATEASKLKLSISERFRLIFGIPLLLHINIYLDNNKVVHTNAVLSTEKALRKAKEQLIKNSIKDE